jgi:hypothetical protein
MANMGMGLLLTQPLVQPLISCPFASRLITPPALTVSPTFMAAWNWRTDILGGDLTILMVLVKICAGAMVPIYVSPFKKYWYITLLYPLVVPVSK